MLKMKLLKYIYGPVPFRRLGISLGVSPIPKKNLQLLLYLLPIRHNRSYDKYQTDVFSPLKISSMNLNMS